jgi:hypothetical protein
VAGATDERKREEVEVAIGYEVDEIQRKAMAILNIRS